MKRTAVLLSLVFGLATAAVGLAPGVGAATGVTGVCSFPISFDVTRAQGDRGHFPAGGPLSAGFFTGQVFVRITNDLNHHSIEVNASGPGFVFDDGTFVLGGTSVVFLFPGDTGDITGPGIFITHGPVLFSQIDGHANTVMNGGSVSGNLCASIA